jgi:hypothetical protein
MLVPAYGQAECNTLSRIHHKADPSQQVTLKPTGQSRVVRIFNKKPRLYSAFDGYCNKRNCENKLYTGYIFSLLESILISLTLSQRLLRNATFEVSKIKDFY